MNLEPASVSRERVAERRAAQALSGTGGLGRWLLAPLIAACLALPPPSWAGKASFRANCLAASRGDVEAAHNLGWIYFNGKAVAQDADLAAGWFKKAADRGDPQSANMLRLLARAEPREDDNCRRLLQARNADRGWVEDGVRSRAPDYGLDPELVLAVIAAESAFDPAAESPKGAKGLMQLMPATARRFGVRDIWDPTDNLHGGMAYLRWLLRHYRGDVTLTLAAYNAGEGAVARYGGVPPYQETRHYIRRVRQDYPEASHPVPDASPRVAGAE
jgi:hypothetical protein